MALVDVLRRFRPAGAPGAAGPVGVPADGQDKAAAELAPVFAELAPFVEQAAAIRANAAMAAAARIAAADHEAAAILDRASSDALVARAEAAISVRADGRIEARHLLTDAETKVERLRDRGTTVLDELVDAAVDLVRTEFLGSAG